MAKIVAPSKLALVRRYLAFRRELGYRMRSAELLLDFGRFADRQAPEKPLTTSLALQWATSVSATRKTQAGRLGMVRGFARYCASLDGQTQIPDAYLLGPSFQRVRPHVFDTAEIKLLLDRARRLETRRSPLHPLTYQTLIGLLAATGMRPGEALRLRCRDFKADQGALLIQKCKFSPERVIPLHLTATNALLHYRQKRQRLFPWGEALFVDVYGCPLSHRRAEKVFQRLARGLVSRSERGSVRLIDFRHTFASRLISQWSRQAQPVAHHLLLLARYLGHRTFNSTWWYVSSDPIALKAASNRFDQFHNSRHAA